MAKKQIANSRSTPLTEISITKSKPGLVSSISAIDHPQPGEEMDLAFWSLVEIWGFEFET